MEDMLDWPYRLGGNDASGCDCWGLVREVFARCGVDLPTLVEGDSGRIFATFSLIPYPTELLDVYFIDRGQGHCGVLVKPGEFLMTDSTSGVHRLSVARLKRYTKSPITFHRCLLL